MPAPATRSPFTLSSMEMTLLPEPGRVLRDLVEADIAVFFEHQRDPEANRMAAFPARDEETFVAHWQSNTML